MAERAHPEHPGFRKRWHISIQMRPKPQIAIERNIYRQTFFWRYKWVSRHCRDRDVLDVPCGMGWGTSLLKGCKTLIGVDIDHGAISEARRRYSYRAEFIVADLGKLGFADSTFDIVACLEGIEHVPPDVGQAFLAESYRVLRRQGVLFLSSPHCCTMEHSGNPHHFKEYTYHEIRSLVDPYFQIAQVAERSVGNLRVFYLQAIKTK